MTNPTRNTVLGLFAVTAAMMMPLAFAQSTSNTATQSVTTPPPAAKSIAPTPTTPATGNVDPQASAPSTSLAAGGGNQKSWSDLDTNKDGNISKSEATGDVALNALFAKADANTDGSLTPDEYRAYLAANQASVSHKQ